MVSPGGVEPIRYVCMPGSPYTGSTMLGFLLHNHPSCVSIGAATGLTARVDLTTYQCSCGARFVDCAFWNRIAERTAELGHPVTVFRSNFWNTHVRLSSNRTLNGVLIRSLGHPLLDDARDAVIGRLGPVRRVIEEARWSTWSLARAVLETTGKSVFVDTARDHQRPKYLAGHPGIDLRAIHLVRDPRGNTVSIMKHTGVDLATAARQWKHYNAAADRARRYLSAEAWLRLDYDELCLQPQATMDRASDFLGVEPAPVPENFQKVEHHIIGNSMRLSGAGAIRLDTSWQDRLSKADLDTIARITGPTAHALGLPWP